MTYCLKCGSKVEDTMTFCPECGTQLKEAAPTQSTSSEPSSKQDNPTTNVEPPKPLTSPKVKEHERAEYSFIKYLVGGLILITVGISAILELTNPALASGEYLALMLLVVGLILIFGAVYYALSGRKSTHLSPLEEKTEKKPMQLPA